MPVRAFVPLCVMWFDSFEGENGTGKTTFIRMLAGLLKSDEQSEAEAAGDEELAQSVRGLARPCGGCCWWGWGCY